MLLERPRPDKSGAGGTTIDVEQRPDGTLQGTPRRCRSEEARGDSVSPLSRVLFEALPYLLAFAAAAIIPRRQGAFERFGFGIIGVLELADGARYVAQRGRSSHGAVAKSGRRCSA
ncbi:MAG: hypothetical protein QM756_31695 [Polyangiaceae bacterium]